MVVRLLSKPWGGASPLTRHMHSDHLQIALPSFCGCCFLWCCFFCCCWCRRGCGANHQRSIGGIDELVPLFLLFATRGHFCCRKGITLQGHFSQLHLALLLQNLLLLLQNLHLVCRSLFGVVDLRLQPPSLRSQLCNLCVHLLLLLPLLRLQGIQLLLHLLCIVEAFFELGLLQIGDPPHRRHPHLLLQLLHCLLHVFNGLFPPSGRDVNDSFRRLLLLFGLLFVLCLVVWWEHGQTWTGAHGIRTSHSSIRSSIHSSIHSSRQSSSHSSRHSSNTGKEAVVAW
mmetsp:Transcript_9095/g.17146  ORF Transcript_9095/g.17146 Transcript_9095/m.17146 type:complete len:284 (-) Transcript_9095:300-1151(-)